MFKSSFLHADSVAIILFIGKSEAILTDFRSVKITPQQMQIFSLKETIHLGLPKL